MTGPCVHPGQGVVLSLGSEAMATPLPDTVGVYEVRIQAD